MKDQHIGIIGCGVVGTAVASAFKRAHFLVTEYDKYKQIGTLPNVVALADMIFVCVPTPTDDHGTQDRSSLHEVLARLDELKYCGPVIVKCTVVPGTMDSLQETYTKLNLIHNPEFLTEKNAERDFLEQVCVLISGRGTARHMVVHAYIKCLPGASIHAHPDFKTTELAKYLHNCFLATKVAFMNEMYDYAKSIGADYGTSAMMASDQERIGKSHLQVPGPDGKRGFGGMCFPKDTQALLDVSHGALTILQAAVNANKKVRGG